MLDIKNLKNEPGICPFCGSDNLGYGQAEFDSNTVCYHWKCMECKNKGIEWYSLKFDRHDICDEDGNFIKLC